MEITISGKDKKRLRLVEQLAKELGLSITKSGFNEKEETGGNTAKDRSERPNKLMKEMVDSGGLDSIKDPLEWQREVREDKKLYGRE